MEPRWFLSCLPLLSSINIHASCRIGSNALKSEEMPNFTKANPSSSFDQGKHQEFPFIRAFSFETFTLCF
jgi:hypothetical protein